MMAEVQQILQWVAMHPHWAYATVGVVAFLESLGFIGLIFPGALLMFGAGALVAAGVVGFWPTFIVAVLGAILGDSLSYEWGRHFGPRIRRVWPFRRHPRILERGEQFIRRHGGKSIALGRFVGPVRPVVTVVAGMLSMRRRRFYITNTVSALAWAPAYLLPGIAFGMALSLASEAAARLAVLICIVSAMMAAVVWSVRFAQRHLLTNAADWSESLVAWGQKRHGVVRLIADLFDSHHQPHWVLLSWLAILLGGTWLFLGVLEDVLTGDQLVSAGWSVYQFLQQLRTPLGDRAMIAVTELGDAAVTAPLIILVAAWLLIARRRRDLVYWLAAVGGGALIVNVLKWSLHVPRPVELDRGISGYSFPSGHATMSMIVYGFLTTFIASSLSPRIRTALYGAMALLIGSIAFSRLYLGAHWLADIVAGLSVGSAWVALLTIARRRHANDIILSHSFAALTAVGFLLAAGFHMRARFSYDIDRYAVRHSIGSVSQQEWLATAWSAMPAYRMDIEGENEQPMNVQYAGSLNQLKSELNARGWHDSTRPTLRSVLQCIAPSPLIEDVPVLPKLHNGRFDALRLVHLGGKHATAEAEQFILRLWPTEVRVQPGNQPLWTGYVGRQKLQRFPLLTFPRSAGVDDEPLTTLESSLSKETQRKEVQREKREHGKGTHWNGVSVLIWR